MFNHTNTTSTRLRHHGAVLKTYDHYQWSCTGEQNMQRIYLTRHDPAKNMHRFYQMHVAPGIFGDWSLIREWGRIGSPGTIRKNWYMTEAEAIQFAEKLCVAKLKKGYQPIIIKT